MITSTLLIGAFIYFILLGVIVTMLMSNGKDDED